MRTFFILIALFAFINLDAQRIYVDSDYPQGDGQSWQTPFNDLNTALDYACMNGIDEVFVATGHYAVTDNSPEDFLSICNDIKIYGGFENGQEDLGQRIGRSIIDGGFENGNVHSLFVIFDVNNFLIDGFLLTGGVALETAGIGGPQKEGGAAHILYSNGIFKNCEFNVNMAITGGALYVGNSSYIELKDCVFTGNLSDSQGASVFVSNSEVLAQRCRFNFNIAEGGGAAFGAFGSDINATNCSFENAISSFEGAAIYLFNSDMGVRNCTFLGNTASSGSCIYSINGTISVLNSIMWDNNGTAISGFSNLVNIAYSLIQGSGGSDNWNSELGNDFGGNIDENPLFATVGDFSFIIDEQSPAFQTGIAALINESYYELTANGFVDIFSNKRIYNDRVSMGCQEPVQISGTGGLPTIEPAIYSPIEKAQFFVINGGIVPVHINNEIEMAANDFMIFCPFTGRIIKIVNSANSLETNLPNGFYGIVKINI